jgi:translation initiation factor 2 beta subunit (eIF-2beta)/eIF-5
MLGLALVRLIESHSETLARGVAEQIVTSERTSDFREIPPEELQQAATEVYRNLGEWLLQKTERDIKLRFETIAIRRSHQGVRLHQFVWALMISRDHLWHFLQREACADNVVDLHGELELHRRLHQFFDRAIYYGILGYEMVEQLYGLKTHSVTHKSDTWPYQFA